MFRKKNNSVSDFDRGYGYGYRNGRDDGYMEGQRDAFLRKYTPNEIREAFEAAIGVDIKDAERAGVKLSDDPVNHPSHYTDGKIEVIDFITDKKLGFCLGNAVKYIARAGKKDPSKTIEDLEKAIWYIKHHIETLKEGNR